MFSQFFVVLLTCAAAIVAFSRPAAAQTSESPLDRALRVFDAVSRDEASVVLRALRPPPAGSEERARALARLPEDGELRPDRAERKKLALIEAVLVYHERAGVFDLKLIDLPQAVVGLYDRSILLVSRPALRLMSGVELQASVAHEVGHDYFWKDYETVLRQRDARGRQELELKCDAVAVLTLVALSVDTRVLLDGIRKAAALNDRLGATFGAEDYPTLAERERFIRVLLQLKAR